MRLLVLLTDAFGGHGGIAKFNRDLLSAICSCPEVESVVVLPRLLPYSPGDLPPKMQYDLSGVGGKLRYLRSVFRVARNCGGSSATNSHTSPVFDLILCGHVNLLPAAFLAQNMMRRPLRSTFSAQSSAPIVLIIHGIDAWRPTRNWLTNAFARRIDAFISVSEFTKRRFLAWAKVTSAPNFILPNCVDLQRFTPGPKKPDLLDRYGLRGRKVLLTVARLSAQERYKGADQVLEVLPDLAREHANLSYVVVGEGNDRQRLVGKARLLGLHVCVQSGDNRAGDESALCSEAIKKDAGTFDVDPSGFESRCPNVIFTGYVSEEDKADYYRLADVFVMPGWGEGFGIVYLEALACGIPVVASKVDASRETLREGAWARLVNPQDPVEVREAILQALRDPSGKLIAGIEDYSYANFRSRCSQIFRKLKESVELVATPDDHQVSSSIARASCSGVDATGISPSQGRSASAEGNADQRALRILVFRIGQLGDTIVSLPALWAIRNHYPAASLTLLCDRHPGKQYVLAADLLQGTGIFDQIDSYIVDSSPTGRVLRFWHMAQLLLKLRMRKFDLLVYLAPSTRRASDVARDRRFFTAAGIRQCIGMSAFPSLPRKMHGQSLGSTPPESDLLLARLGADGIVIPAEGQGCLDLRLNEADQGAFEAWLSKQSGDGDRRWIGVGPGSKMPAKRWPEDRFRMLVQNLIAGFNIWPVVFGGTEDMDIGNRLVQAWGRGYNAAGALSLRAAAAGLQRCAIYLGNDTGTMHLAAAAGTPCVAIFSSREWPGMWFPYQVPQRIFRSNIECEGCTLIKCEERQNECLARITVGAVEKSCAELLGMPRTAKAVCETVVTHA